MGRVTANVQLRHPDTGAVVTLVEGVEIPDWADALVGDHVRDDAASASETTSDDEPTPEGPPPRAGKGSGRDAWAAFAAGKVEVADEDGRDEIIAALEQAGVIDAEA